MHHIGYIGLGLMGQACAINLLKAGFTVYGYARNPQRVRPFIEAGGQLQESIIAVAEKAAVLITNLPDSKDVKQVLLEQQTGAINGLKAGSIVMDMSTIDPSQAITIQQALKQEGIEFVDAPVSGGSVGAAEGSLSFMVGGKSEIVRCLQPLFDVMGSQTVHVGEVGHGQLCKCCNQMMIAQLINAVSEVIRFAQVAGLDVPKVRQALLGGFAASRALEVHGLRMLQNSYQPGFKAVLHQKDMRIVDQVCQQLDFDASGSKQAQILIEQLVREGKGELDSAAIHTLRR